MNATKKYLSFLESIKTPENKAVIEASQQAFKMLFESNEMGKYAPSLRKEPTKSTVDVNWDDLSEEELEEWYEKQDEANEAKRLKYQIAGTNKYSPEDYEDAYNEWGERYDNQPRKPFTPEEMRELPSGDEYDKNERILKYLQSLK